MKTLAALAALLLAGCLGAEAPAAGRGIPSDVSFAGLDPRTHVFEVSNAVSDGGAGVEPTEAERFTVEIPAGYSNITAELKVTCRTPTCDYGFFFGRKGEPGRFHAEGRLAQAIAPGVYEFAVRSNGPSVGMAGTLLVTVS